MENYLPTAWVLDTWFTQESAVFWPLKAAPRQIQNKYCRHGVSNMQVATTWFEYYPMILQFLTLYMSSQSSGKRKMPKVKAEQGDSFKQATGSISLYPSGFFPECFPLVLLFGPKYRQYLPLMRKLPIVESGSNIFWPLSLVRNLSPIWIKVICSTLNIWNRVL